MKIINKPRLRLLKKEVRGVLWEVAFKGGTEPRKDRFR